MSIKSYKGNPNKGIWENSRFNKGMNYTNEPMREGSVKAMANIDISKTGASGRPRAPYFSSAFRSTGAPFGLGQNAIQFQAQQDLTYNYYLDIGRFPTQNKTVEFGPVSAGIISVVDGDTVDIYGKRYRLLAIDAPESTDPLYNTAKQFLIDYIANIASGVNSGSIVKVVYDRYNLSHINSPTEEFDQRDLVWLYIGDVNINEYMFINGMALYYGERDHTTGPFIMPEYDLLDIDTWEVNRAALITSPVGTVYENYSAPSVIHQFIGYSGLSIYKRHNNDLIEPYQENSTYLKTPVVRVEHDIRVSLDKLYEDLELRPGYAVQIEMLNTEYSKDMSTHVFKNKTRPFIRYVSDTHDGILFLGKVTDNEGTLYEGMISVNYIVPLDRDDGIYPQFDKAYFAISTYNKNVFEISLENLDSYSINMLDKTPIEIESYWGQTAIDKEYLYPELRSVLLKRNGNYIKKPKYGLDYIIEPIFAMPTLGLDNGYDGYEGYAIRYDIFNINRNSNDNDDPVISTGWVRTETGYTRIIGEKIWVRVGSGYDSNDNPNLIKNQFDELPESEKVSYMYNPYIANEPVFDMKSLYAQGLDTLTENSHTSNYGDINPLNNNIGTLMKIVFGDTTSDPTEKESYYRCTGLYNYLETSMDELFKASKHGIRVVVKIVPVKTFIDNKYPSSIDGLEQAAITYDSGTYLYTSGDEERLKFYNHGEELYTAKDISQFDGRVLLYGCEKTRNVIYMSDTFNHTYFPLNYTLDQFVDPVVHVQPFGEVLIVFTTSDIYMVYNEPVQTEFGDLIDTYLTKKIINNITVEAFNKDTVVTVGKYLMFVANDNVYIIKPNIYVTDPTDVFISTVGNQISELLYNPTAYIARRHQYYGATGDIFSESFKPEIEIKSFVSNNILSVFMSTNINQLDILDDGMFMVEMLFDVEKGTWKLYDTKACSHPIQKVIFDSTEGPRYLMSNHPTVKGGTSVVTRSGLNLQDFEEGFGKILDIKSIKISGGVAVYNTELNTASDELIFKVKQPIHGYINSGNMAINPHLFKRFHQIILDVTNIDCLSLPMTLDFSVDGHLRQNSRNISMVQVVDGSSGNILTTYQSTVLDEGLSFDTWGLDVSRFGPLQTLKIKLPVSGRGRYASVEVGFKTTGMFEIFKYAVIYKEQTVR